jgi:hypothetical protein
LAYYTSPQDLLIASPERLAYYTSIMLVNRRFYLIIITIIAELFTMKTYNPSLILPDFRSRLSPLALMIADKLQERITEKLENLTPKDDISEVYGDFAMASMFSEYGEGNMSESQVYAFMSRMAISKTPAPVQKTETLTTINIKETLRELMAENVDAFTTTQELADKRRIEIMERLKADNKLMLMKDDKIEVSGDEPEEIRRLRDNG